MPRPVHSQGRPGTQVIPDDWSATLRPVATKTMTGTCELRKPGMPTTDFDPTTGTTTGQPYPPYFTGPCRVQVVTRSPSEALAAGQQVTSMAYLVTVPWDAGSGHRDDQDAHVDDLCAVTAAGSDGDPSLTNVTLKVTGVARGTLTWERDLTCTDDLG